MHRRPIQKQKFNPLPIDQKQRTPLRMPPRMEGDDKAYGTHNRKKPKKEIS